MIQLNAAANFCRRMGIGLRSGVDILRLLENETKTGKPRHRQVMDDVLDEVQSGTTLAKAMQSRGDYFPPLLIQMVRASELAGRMDSMFHYMADYYQDLKQTRSHFVAQITWPIIQLILAICVIGLVILIQGLLSGGSDIAYDASGIGLSGIGGFITYCVVVGTVLTILLVTAYGIWKNWLDCHRLLMPLVQRVPLLGTALTTLGLSRLSMTLSILLNAGVEAKRSTRQAFLATGNHYFISGMDRAVEQISQGASFGDAFAAAAVLPDDFIEAIHVGELSGTETESLDSLAQQYRERAKSALNTIATIASIAIWISIMLLIAVMIIRMALQYINMLNDFLP